MNMEVQGDYESGECGAKVDSNQQATFDREVQRLLDNNQDMDMPEALDIALSVVRGNIPTLSEAAGAIAAMRKGTTYCYLAFYGLNEIASYMKVGVSRHPERRIYDIATGNPLDCLWVYFLACPSSEKAFSIEKKLLNHLKENKRRGEWLNVGATNRPSAESLARQLGGVANVNEARFMLMGV